MINIVVEGLRVQSILWWEERVQYGSGKVGESD